MPIIIDSYKQGEPEWFLARLGNPGASSISKIITNKGDRSKQADDYMYELAGELITGVKAETYTNATMQRGIELEGEARALFEVITDIEVRQVAVVYKDEQRKIHVSPDGLIGNNAGLELKNPMIKTHVKYLLKNKLPSEYFSQIQMSLYVCEREYWFFMSYYPGIKPLIIKVSRDEEFIERLKVALDSFCLELIMTVKKLRKLNA